MSKQSSKGTCKGKARSSSAARSSRSTRCRAVPSGAERCRAVPSGAERCEGRCSVARTCGGVALTKNDFGRAIPARDDVMSHLLLEHWRRARRRLRFAAPGFDRRALFRILHLVVLLGARILLAFRLVGGRRVDPGEAKVAEA